MVAKEVKLMALQRRIRIHQYLDDCNHVQDPSLRLHLKHSNCHLLFFEPLAGFWEKFEALLRPFCPSYQYLICFQAGVVGFRSGCCIDLPLEEAYGWKQPGFLCELPEEHLSSLRDFVFSLDQ